MNSSKATKIIVETPGGTDTKLFIRDICSHELMKGIGEERIIEFENRYNALDVGVQSNLFNASIEYNTLKYENLNDPDAINLINSKYFTNNPLDLFRL
jgi:hypothetical protein